MDRGMKVWIGRSVLFIALIHSLFGFAVFAQSVIDIAREGIVNTVSGQADREWAFWFIACGFTWFLLGWLIDHIEKRGGDLPRCFGVVTLLLVAISVTIMPASGFWLGFIPAIGLISQTRRRAREIDSQTL